MNIRRHIKFPFWEILFVAIFVVLSTTATPMMAAEQIENPEEPVAFARYGSGGIDWEPRVEFQVLDLNVSCPAGYLFNKQFKSGEHPFLAVEELAKAIPDIEGGYTYELRVFGMEQKQKGDEYRDGLLPRPYLSQTGYFRIVEGKIATSEEPEKGADRAMDQPIYDDLIVTGSLCVGFDCAVGESFGFDTIILKEHNLRIYFNDTSYAASYPRNDWRIEINSSANGGASYFAVQDATAVRNVFVVEAGAPSNSLYVDDGGKIGIKTSTPYFELHMKDGDSPAVRLEQDGSYGFEPQTFDVCGNESNFFIRDATHGSTLPFRIQPGAPTSSLTIRETGNVGVGTWAPAVPLELETTGEWATFYAQRTDGATAQVAGGETDVWIGAQSNHPLKICVNDDAKIVVDTDGDVGIGVANPTYKIHVVGGAYCNGTQWQDVSSRKYKEKIRSLSTEEAFNTLEELTPVKFFYKSQKDEECLGFIAEDVPELVATKNREGMSSMDVVAVLTKVLKEQQKTISKLNQRIDELEKTIKK